MRRKYRYISLSQEETLDSTLLAARSFVVARFEEEWGIYRTDITVGSISPNHHLAAVLNNSIIAWIDVAPNGELCHACVKDGVPGFPVLSRLIHRAYTLFPGRAFYAYVPILRLASAAIFCRCGMAPDLSGEDGQKTLLYQASSIHLAKLVRVANMRRYLEVEASLNQLRDLAYDKQVSRHSD
jgi:hypothetical protein